MSGAAQPSDPSMEDILASIRRILSEDETAKPEDAPAAHTQQPHDDVLQLDESMMVAQPEPAPDHSHEPEPIAVPPEAAPAAEVMAPVIAEASLLAPETAQAATDSVGTLLRRLVVEREQIVVHRSGPTLEDMVREELRPLLKAWLDTNLPEMVERHVRVEIERVIGRAIP